MAKTFKSAFKVIEKAASDNGTALHRTFTVNMLNKIARDTPVDTGLATGNWILQSGSPNLTPQTIKDPSNSATITTQRAEKAARTSTKGQPLYVSNAVQGRDDSGAFTGEGYIIGLEDGKSVQAPAGMFLKNIAMASVISARSKREVFK